MNNNDYLCQFMRTNSYHIIRNMRKNIIHIMAFLMAAITCSSCEWLDFINCQPDNEARKVLLLYSAGFNSLSSYLISDIEDLKKGELPGNRCDDDILLVYSHQPSKHGTYNVSTPSHLTRIFRNKDGVTVCDTLVTYPEGTISSSALQLNNVLTYVRDTYPSGSYGMIFSSHATGYLPAGYYTSPDTYFFSGSTMARKAGIYPRIPAPVPYIEPEHDPSLPAVKSIGQDQTGIKGSYLSYEIELGDFAEAIPMHMDYILFDACLMGGIETAYELKDKCSMVGFSQTEVLAEGFNYPTLTKHLLMKERPDPKSVCDDYFQQYALQSGVYQSATISCIDCGKLDPLAETCRELFNKYETELKLIDPLTVQKYYRSNYHWFYDMRDIIKEAGATEEELLEVDKALAACTIYKAHTRSFMGSFAINAFSGLSMYLPCNGSTELDKYYRTLLWNQDTELVK